MEFVRQAARDADFDEQSLLKVDLIIEEVFLNIAMHGYRGRPPGKVVVLCSSPQSGVLTVESQDWADEFNPLYGDASAALDVPLNERREGGLGLLLVKNMAESVAYQRIADHNKLTIRIVA